MEQATPQLPPAEHAQQVRIFVIAALVAAGILMIILAFQARARQAEKIRTHSTSQVNDFDRWMTMVPQFLHQHVNYVSDSFPTAPVTLMIFAPFTTVSPPAAQFFWACCKYFFVIVIFAACWRMTKNAGVTLSVTALLLILAVWIWPVIIDVQEGQTNLLMLLPLTTGLLVAQMEDRWYSPWLGGLLVSLAICIKVTPLIFLVYFLYRRRWRLSLAIVLGIACWLFIVPALAFGWGQNMLWLRQWTNIMIVPYLKRGHIVYFVGQSVPSYLGRLLRHVPAFHWHDGARVTPVYINIVNLPGPVVDVLTRVVLGAIALAGAWWMRHKLPTLRSRRYLLEIGCVAAFMLWASERTWVPHYVTLGITLFATAMVFSDPEEPFESQRRAMVALIAAAVLMFFTSDVAKIFGPNGGQIMRTVGVSLWAGVLLVVANVRSRAGGNTTMIPPAPATTAEAAAS